MIDGRVIAIVAAVAENGVIGNGGAMPWRLSSDLRRFKALTLGKPVVMGRKTFDSIGKPLPGRTNVVVSRRADYAAEGIVVVPDLETALRRAAAVASTGADEVMVIGGGEIYRATIGRADRLYITHVEASPDGDVHFPTIDPATWTAVSSETVPRGEKDSAATTFVVYERRGGGVASG
jgi:dihydrofolate reductase